MSDILDIAKFDAGVRTAEGRKQFSFVETAGSLIGNREYKESFDRFTDGCSCQEQYLWRALSAVGDSTGKVLYENVKNYIDYVTNVDLCKVQALRSMVKMYGLEYRIFDNLDMLPAEVLDLVNIFSIGKKYVVYGEKLLDAYRERLSDECVIYDYRDYSTPPSSGVSSTVISSVLDYSYPVGGKYYDFVVNSFIQVLSGFVSMPYEPGGTPIYALSDEYGIYDELKQSRSIYTQLYRENSEKDNRRKYKIANGVPLSFDESAALDRIEAGLEYEDQYSGAKADLIQMEREYRSKPYKNGDRVSRYAFYKKRRVLEYENFIVNKYFSDHKNNQLSTYPYDTNYFEINFRRGSGETPESVYDTTGSRLVYIDDSNNYRLSGDMISAVAQSLADTTFYISDIREKIKLQTRKNYMKGTYDLMLYVINEFLVDYSRTNPIFRDQTLISSYTQSLSDGLSTVSDLLMPIFSDLSSHSLNNLTAIEYFDDTEYYNISAPTDGRSDMMGVNDRFWENPGGEELFRHDGKDPDFDAKSIYSFYMDTLGMRDNYISDETSLSAFLDAVFSLGAMDSFVHQVSADENGRLESPRELFGAQIEKYGQYSDDLYKAYLDLRGAWTTLVSYLSGEDYQYPEFTSVSAQVLSAAAFARDAILEKQLSSVSSVYDAYIDRANSLSDLITQGIADYNDLLSGEYAFYFNKAEKYEYCFDPGTGEYKHEWYVNSNFDVGLDYWYDMLQKVEEYVAGFDANGDYITNWPIRDTAQYFYNKFIELSSMYMSIVGGGIQPTLGVTEGHDWSNEYGFVDIQSISLEGELKYGYDFMTKQLADRKQLLNDIINDIKSRATELQSLAQQIKSTLASALASYDDNRDDQYLGVDTVYCVSRQAVTRGGWHRQQSKPPKDSTAGFDTIVREEIDGTVWYYYNKDDATSNVSAFSTTIVQYNPSGSVLDRCEAINEYMNAPTSYMIKSGNIQYFYSMRNDGVQAAIDQVALDWESLSASVDGLIKQLTDLGYDGFEKPLDKDVDGVIVKLIEYINSALDESVLEKDPKIDAYKTYIRAIIQLSSIYQPIKYEYDSIYKDSKQQSYLSEFQQDTDMTLQAISRLSAYSVDRDFSNKGAILQKISGMKQRYQDAVEAYNEVAEDLSKEYMLPHGFQPYAGYIEEMMDSMREALAEDVDHKTILAHDIAQDEYEKNLYPAMEKILVGISPYGNSKYSLPVAVKKRLNELYIFNKPGYTKQKEMFLTYGGRSFCYYPYYNLKNVVHSSYQVHPFLWNFIKGDSMNQLAQRTFFSVNVDELEDENVESTWRSYFGEYGETKYRDLSKARYPDYSGYQSRYESSNHVAEDTQFVSEVVDYDGAFYPPAVEYLRKGFDVAISSVQDCKYRQLMVNEACGAVYRLSSLEWREVSGYLDSMRDYMLPNSIDTAMSYVYEKCYIGRSLSNLTAREVCKTITDSLSGEDTFYGRFYRQLKLDQEINRPLKNYIVQQISAYWNGGDDIPSISDITRDRQLFDAYDIYKYGIDSYGNMYCLYKQYPAEAVISAALHGGLNYKFRQNTPGELWIRLKYHPLAFPAFSGKYPNIYQADTGKRHKAFVNLMPFEPDFVKSSAASCIYDFEFTKDRRDVTFVTRMRDSQLTCDSPDIQQYQNSWLVMCRIGQETLTSDSDLGRPVFTLYPPTDEVDYFKSGANYLVNPVLSSTDALSGDGCWPYQYIGSYLKGNSNIFHVYAKKHVYKDGAGAVEREATGEIKIFPVINGYYKAGDEILGMLDGVVGGDVCVSYDETMGIVNFAAQTLLPDNASISTDTDKIFLSANVDGPTIDDPTDANMNSHDVFDTNITIFRRQIVSKQLREIKNSSGRTYDFNVNADMSYLPTYPGLAGIKQLYKNKDWYDGYSVELLGTAKDLQEQISFINPNPDPYFDMDDIQSNFAHARVYEDYKEYMDETLKIINNKLIGVNSDVFNDSSREQFVISADNSLVWRLNLNKIYSNIDLAGAAKLKVLLFNKKCCGKNPYLFSDISSLQSGWADLGYDTEDTSFDEYSVISAADYTFGYGNRVIAQATLDGVGEIGMNDSNHIHNVCSLQARLSSDDALGGDMVLEFKFRVQDESLGSYTFVPEDQLQAVLLDVRNLEAFNYFHYLDAYGILRVIDNFRTMEELKARLTVHGDGWTIYHTGHTFTEEELMQRLKSYYEYKNALIPLSSVDLSQYDCLSDVYILQGSRRLQYKVDEEFRYELSHPGYFYPTINAKFPLNPAQYTMQRTTFKENAAADVFFNVFGQRNLFLLDMEDPDEIIGKIGRVDVPITLDDSECVFAYEDYLEPAPGSLSSLRNCDLYGDTDPRVLQFVQFEADPEDISRGVSKSDGSGYDIPDSLVTNVEIDSALSDISSYMSGSKGVDCMAIAQSEEGRSRYTREYVGFTLDDGSFTRQRMEELLRIYVNYGKCDDGGIRLYFNYMNYLNSPYLKMADNRTYIDTMDNTYLSLKPDENGVLDIVTQFRYYKGGQLYGYKNVTLASYQIYNISDDKPKFFIKRINAISRGDGSNATVQPMVYARICDNELDVSSGGTERVKFDVIFAFESNMDFEKADFYLDYPSDLMEFVGLDVYGSVSGSGWTLRREQPGYVKLSVSAGVCDISMPAMTNSSADVLKQAGNQSVIVYLDRAEVVGKNGMYAQIGSDYGTISVKAE